MICEVNRTGYLVNFDAPDGPRTYACADKESLAVLMERLTGKPFDSLPKRPDGLPSNKDYPRQGSYTVAHPLHIYRASSL